MRWLLLLPLVGHAQEPLTLADAVRQAQSNHPSIAATRARVNAATNRIEQSRSGMRPKVNYQESYQRSNNPVYVFSTLLTQRRFLENNFRVDSLNHPDSLNNFQSVLSVDQTLYDFGLTRRQTEASQLQRQLTDQERRTLEMNLAATAGRIYLGVQLAAEALRVAEQSVLAAEADVKRADTVRTAGMATDADVLSLQVHLAAMREAEIERRSDLDIGRAALNETLGAPLDTPHQLTTPLTEMKVQPTAITELEKQSIAQRPDAQQARLGVDLAQKQTEVARAALYPQITVHGALEADRGKFVTQGGANWYAAISLRWNLFNGFADRSRIRESESVAKSYQAQQQQMRGILQLQVRKAYAELTAANERIRAAQASIAQAEESLRITRNRYDAGLSTVTDLLRTETARHQSALRRLVAIHDQRVAAIQLDLAAGSLTADSEVLR